MTTDAPSTMGLSDEPARVDLILSLEPPRQRRPSIFLRWLLALPHFIVLEVISFVAVFGALGGWFAALFTGRLPTGLQKFFVGYLRYNANVISYSTLLIDKWPSINFERQADSLVDLEVNQVRLNRLAVLGRVVLVIPAMVVSGLFDFGIYPCLFTMWVVGSITGQVPRSLHQAVATILRFQIRLNAYLFLVTPSQPFSGIFGDGVVVASKVVDGREVAAPLTDDRAEDRESSTPPTGSWRIVEGARRLIVLTLVIGIIGSTLYFSLVPIRSSSTQNDRALFQAVGNSYEASQSELNIISKAFAACPDPTCIAAAIEGAGDRHLYQTTLALEKQAPYPKDISSDVSKYVVYLIDFQKDINAMAKSTTIAQQKAIVTDKIELDVGNLTYRGINVLIYLGEQEMFSFMNY